VINFPQIEEAAFSTKLTWMIASKERQLVYACFTEQIQSAILLEEKGPAKIKVNIVAEVNKLKLRIQEHFQTYQPTGSHVTPSTARWYAPPSA
jgi:hypothetical protein